MMIKNKPKTGHKKSVKFLPNPTLLSPQTAKKKKGPSSPEKGLTKSLLKVKQTIQAASPESTKRKEVD